MLTATNIDIRAASPSDAKEIYSLKISAFRQTSIPYTIYQDPRSSRYIAWAIRRGPKRTGIQFFVTGATHILGYYQAVERDGVFFLNYIAVTKAAQRQGIGDGLLRHFEATGLDLGYRRFALDVFRDNQSVLRWYERHGYRVRTSSYLVRVPMDSLMAEEGEILEYGLLDEFRARRREARLGFSSLECHIGDTPITVGLIGEDRCKLLSEVKDVRYAAGSIARTFHGERRTLILSGLSGLPRTWIPECWDRTLRMEKRSYQP
jgi:ribosomal protein S18 acetylase RimI-like enzyme